MLKRSNTIETPDAESSASQPKRAYKSKSSDSEVGSTPKSFMVEYGPIRVRHRRGQSQTLATGRRPKDAPDLEEDPMKREMRRTKNRLAARELKRSRDNIELGLLRQIEELEQEKDRLEEQHKRLEEQKTTLNRAIYNIKLAPLVPLITNIDLPVLFGPKQREGLLIDLRPLLRCIEDQ